MTYRKAGYATPAEYTIDRATAIDALDQLQDHYGLQVSQMKFTSGMQSVAYYATKRINIGMAGVLHWRSLGFTEYCTLQYLLGLKWRRGETERQRSKFLIASKAVKAIVCHEYAHLLCYETYGKVLGRNHGIFFQQIVAEIYDFMFGDDFGAVDRFLAKKGKQWLGEVKAFEIAMKAKEEGRL
ncbi:MAG: SprT-like domain-containing protein [Candidatus Thorarchaeota archaeon]|jgi:hypothetical protein